MIRRSTAALALVALSLAPIATAADLKANINAASRYENPLSGTVGRLFAKSVVMDVETTEDGMMIATPVFPHVMVLSITENGDTASGCVDNEHSANRILSRGNAKIERPDVAPKGTTAGKDH